MYLSMERPSLQMYSLHAFPNLEKKNELGMSLGKQGIQKSNRNQ